MAEVLVEDSFAWVTPRQTGAPPPKRSGHSLCIINSAAYVFGGLGFKMPPGPTAELCVGRLGRGSIEWSIPAAAAEGGPSARWDHSAVAHGSSMVVFGGFANNTDRLNDIWKLELPAMKWHSIAPSASGAGAAAGGPEGTGKAEEEEAASIAAAVMGETDASSGGDAVEEALPHPRGAHSAVVISDVMYVFGGYGGNNFTRKDYNDVFALDLKAWSWSKVAFKGIAPAPRSGHAACAVRQEMLVCGGWNTMENFTDLHSFDTATRTWRQLSTQFSAPRWNLAMVSAESVPDWKVFVFGGCVAGEEGKSRVQGDYVADLQYLRMGNAATGGSAGPGEGESTGEDAAQAETGQNDWQLVAQQGEGPEPCADSAIAYDTRSCTLYIVGGWANRWLDVVRCMDVRGLVGPPYAIMGVEPSTGPITGGTPLRVRGLRFPQGSVTVLFASRKVREEVAAEVKDDCTLVCTTPDMSRAGSGRVEVRVACGNQPYTVTKRHFDFFSVADATRTLAFGPGLMEGCSTAPGKNVFVISSRDKSGMQRVCGGDQFTVRVSPRDKVALQAAGEGSVGAAAGAGAGTAGAEADAPATAAAAAIRDLGNGLYEVQYEVPGPGEYEVDVRFEGTFGGVAGSLWGMPRSVKVVQVQEGSVAAAAAVGMKDMVSGRFVRALANSAGANARTVTSMMQGLRVKVQDSNLEQVVAIKTHMFNATTKQAAIQQHIAETKAAAEYLSQHQVRQAQEVMQTVESLSSEWERVQRQLPLTRNAIAPQTKAMGAQLRDEIDGYEAQVNRYAERARMAKHWELRTGYDEALRSIETAEAELAEKRADLAHRVHVATLFEFPELLRPSEAKLAEVRDEMAYLKELWALVQRVERAIEQQYSARWKDVDIEKMEDATKALQKELRVVNKAVRWCDTFRGVDRMVKDFTATCPLIGALHHPSMRERHWAALVKAIKRDIVTPLQDPDMELRSLLQHRLHEHQADVEEITDQALKEDAMEKTIERLSATWSNVAFLVKDAKEGVKHVAMVEEEFELLENDQLVVQGMMASPFFPTFETQITDWNKRLGRVSDTVTLVAEVQRMWSYLEPLFMKSEEVQRALPEDAKLFRTIDAEVRTLVGGMIQDAKVVPACNKEGVLEGLERVNTNLEVCKKSLGEYLDGKRQRFPRFYFVSEADLLDILSNGIIPANIMVHISKVLLSTDKLVLEGEARSPTATTFVAGVGSEDIVFDPPARLGGKVEEYLQVALDGQGNTLRKHMTGAVQRYPTQERLTWLQDNGPDGRPKEAAQIAVLCAAIYFVKEAEDALRAMKTDGDSLRRFLDHQIRQLNDLIILTRTNISKAARTKVMVMITMDTHARDVVQRMILERVDDVSAFQWQSQLKQRFDTSSNTVRIEILDAKFNYGYEYLGNGPRLVITPLTDRIYVTATQALNLKMGCAPAGPAGTGKTETTKDLASALGIICYVFNCSPEMDYKSMGNIFKGLAASGSWGCFDEFNRLVPEVLSVCSVQFKAVCDSVREGRSQVTIEGDTVGCINTTGSFITMNPGYLGRSELPEGLKALFRPITVMVPDLVLICENFLMAEGFQTAKKLASKFYGLYSLLADLLSKQSHYDWGLRAVKSVLVVAGAFLRAEPDLGEEELLMRALRDMNTPKIVEQDRVVFFGLLKDLFPGIDPPRKSDPALEVAVKAAAVERKLHDDDYFCLKCVQLDELMAIRHCTFVMGPPSSGKSQTWRTLAQARKLKPAHVRDLNPKAISTEQLYGYVTMATREWKDGLLSVTMRDLGKIPDSDPKWIVLDGDLDANWIESMNSVMDDNKMLTLASNERIPLKAHMKMIFEIRDLRYASPATVSRAGILWISTNAGTQWRSIVRAWVKQRHAAQHVRDALQALFDTYLPPSLEYVRKKVSLLVPLGPMTMVRTTLFMLDALLTDALLEGDTKEAVVARAQPTVSFCTVWGLGSSLSEKDGVDYAKGFSEFWKAEFSGSGAKFPGRDTVFDYWLNPEEQKFDKWESSPYFAPVPFDSRVNAMSTVTVPTPETCSKSFWVDHLIRLKQPVMLVGNAGCGKTQLVLGLLRGLDSSKTLSTLVNFNFYTSSEKLRATLEAPLEKKTGTNYAPRGIADMIFFLDDLNLPELDPYNTQSAIALVRQHLDYGKWYDPSQPAKGAKHINKCQYIACMNPTAGSFTVNPRLHRHFATFAVGFPGTTSLLTIYQTFLDGHLKHFSQECRDLAANLIGGALGLHKDVSARFRKSAINFHYEFNIRHLSNVFQGLLTSQPEQLSDPEKLVYLWLHESERVYGDRLVSNADIAAYQQLAQSQAKKKFGAINVGKFFAQEKPTPLIFTYDSERVYDQQLSMKDLTKTLQSALDEYNETNAAMNLVLFRDAVRHVCRIARIILSPGGHALLVGVGGSGKQSLSRLAAHLCGYATVRITVTATYGINELKEELQTFYRRAGIKEEGLMFLLTDSQITNEKFLVYINDLLASGDIPDLFAQDDKDGIIGSITSRVKAAGLPVDPTSCWNFFISEVRKNLHMTLCFSPVGDDFRTRCLRFPALVNCTVIDWFQPWPEDALYSVGKSFLEEEDLGAPEVAEGVAKFLPFSFKSVNAAAERYLKLERRYCYTTPKSFLELVALYKSLLGRKRTAISGAIDRLSNGLQKLRSTAETVAQIRADLEGMLADAEQKRERADGIAAQVSKEKAIVEKATAEAQEEADKCGVIQRDVEAQAKSCASDLAKAEPAVAAAMEALNTLNRKDLSNCKTMTTPPPGVDDVFAAVMSLFAGVFLFDGVTKAGKVKDKSWANAKKQMLSKIPEFMDNLMAYKEMVDSGKVPAVNFAEVREYLAMPHFEVETISGKNSAAGGLCAWVINIVSYYDIVVTVEPKRQALALANQQLTEANTKLEKVQREVAELEAKLAVLTEEFNKANAEKQAAINAVESGKRKLDLAERLTRALADENVRWAQNVTQLNAERELLVGDVLLASAFISYIGPFTKKYRDALIDQQWLPFMRTAANGASIPMSDLANPVYILTDEAQIATWSNQGLPTDRVSVENGCIVTNSARWPLLIDPQLQGITWLRDKEKANNLVIVRLGQATLMRSLEKAISSGESVIIENMGERVDAALMPLIQRATIKRGHKQYLLMNNKEIDLSPKFRLYLHTKLSNPHYPPEIQAECTLCNFSVTEDGLEDQLLSLVVKKERSDLARTKSRLISEMNSFKIKIKELEDDILAKLAVAEGDITEDVNLIESLENTKRISNEIGEKVVIAKTTTEQINVTSEKYRPVAARGSLLFFLMNELYKVHTYYVYSLNAFVVVFLRGIDLMSGEAARAAAPVASEESEAPKAASGAGAGAARGKALLKAAVNAQRAVRQLNRASDPNASAMAAVMDTDTDVEPTKTVELSDEELAARCERLMASITEVVFNYVRRGLFETDKLMVATQLCLKILIKAGKLSRSEVEALTLAAPSVDPGNMGPLSEWMPEYIWARVKGMEIIKDVLGRLGETMQEQSDEWRKWFDEEKPEERPMPGDFKALSDFHKLLLLRALRPDRLVLSLAKFVQDSLGPNYVNQPVFDMAATYAETKPSTPVFFVLFPGVDPTVWVESLGKSMDITTENGLFVNISMGQGQEGPAEQALQRLSQKGGWVMLQNCHLMQTWLPRLERTLESVAAEASADFRCFLSAEPPPISHFKNMPESLMQTAIKVANEAPSDLKSNLRRSWAMFAQERIASNERPDQFKGCLFSLCLYHSIILGRRRFGQQGWSRKYSFNNGDLTVCANVLFEYVNSNPSVPWDDLRYIFGEIMYGGHITDFWDRRTNNTYLKVLFTNEKIFTPTEIIPGFATPNVQEYDYDGLATYIEARLPAEEPKLFGMHANAEIGYLGSSAQRLFDTIVMLEGAGGGGGGGGAEAGKGKGGGGGGGVRDIITDLLSRLPENFNMLEIEDRAEKLLSTAAAPFVVVAMQECARMNTLLSDIRRTLLELQMGLNGELNMSDAMEDLQSALSIAQVPGRNIFHKCSWESLAWSSRKSLQPWFSDMLARIQQLTDWTSALILPKSVWLPGLFNPTAFVTAVMQVTARASGKPLDQMTTTTHVTQYSSPDKVPDYPSDGAFIHGWYMEGARWLTGDEAFDAGEEAVIVNGVPTLGCITQSRLKELLAPMPVVYLQAVVVESTWIPESVGYMRVRPDVYEAPVYNTTFRGPTYCFLSTMRTKVPPSTWVLAGVAIIQQLDD